MRGKRERGETYRVGTGSGLTGVVSERILTNRMFSASSERDPMIDTSVILAIGKEMDPRYDHRRSGWKVFVKERWRADGVILGCDEE